MGASECLIDECFVCLRGDEPASKATSQPVTRTMALPINPQDGFMLPIIMIDTLCGHASIHPSWTGMQASKQLLWNGQRSPGAQE